MTCPDVECGGEDYTGCEPWQHTSHLIESLIKDAVLSVEPRGGEFDQLVLSLYRDESVGLYDGVNDETAYVLRGNRKREAIQALASDWHVDYLSDRDRAWVKGLAGIPVNTVILTCSHCQRDYQAQRQRRPYNYCSASCRQKAARQRRSQDRRRMCAVCMRMFTFQRRTALYCSRTCAKRAYRERENTPVILDPSSQRG